MCIITISDRELDAQLQRANENIDLYWGKYKHQNYNFNQALSKLTKSGQVPSNYHQLNQLFRARNGYKLLPKTLEKWQIILVGGQYQLAAINNKKTTSKKLSKVGFTRGLGAWLVYTDLQTKPHYLRAKKAPIPKVDNSTKRKATKHFNNYLTESGLTVDELEKDRRPLYELQDFMQLAAPRGHRVTNCLKHRIHSKKSSGEDRGVFVVCDDKGSVGVGNIARCGSPFCSVCGSYDGIAKHEKSIVVQKTHIANGGECLQLTLTAPHTTRTKIDIFYPKIQRAYEIFNRKTAKYFKELGYVGKLKANEYTYSIKNGHNPHIHVAYAIDAISDPDLEQLQQSLREVWLFALIEVGLVKGGRQKKAAALSAMNLIKNPNAFSYISKIAQTLPKIDNVRAKIAKDKSLTIFELAVMANNREFDKKRFSRVYSQLLEVWHGVTNLKFSPNFLDELGLMVDVDEPVTDCSESAKKSSESDIGNKAASVSEDKKEPKKRQNKRKRRYIHEPPRRKLETIVEIKWELWCELVRAGEHLILLGMFQRECDKEKRYCIGIPKEHH